MKHAGPAALDQLEALLAKIRTLPALKEKSRGVFYLRSKSFLHFHEDPAGLFADLRREQAFERFKVESASERARFFEAVHAELARAV